MELDMVFRETRDEVVRMIVVLLHSQVKWVLRIAASKCEVFWQQLLLVQEVVTRALIDQDWRFYFKPKIVDAFAFFQHSFCAAQSSFW